MQDVETPSSRPSGAAVRNQLTRVHATLEALPLPQGVRRRILSMGMGLSVPYTGRASIEIAEFGSARAVVRVRNRRKVQNHMGSVHASAMFLLAETATGVVVAANLPDGAHYSVTHVEVDYQRRAKGDLTARASLDPTLQGALRSERKGRVRVPVSMIDADGNEPARFVIEWAFKHPKA